MKILEAYIAKSNRWEVVPIDVTKKGVIAIEIKWKYFYVVWIENEFESGPSQQVISYN